jgi:hypothetical protein
VATHPDTTAQQAVHNREIADESVRSAAARRRSQSIRLADKLALTEFDFVGLRNAGRPPGASRLTALLTAAPEANPDRRSPEGAQTAAESNVPQRPVRRAVSSVLGPYRSAVLRGSNVAPIPAVDPAQSEVGKAACAANRSAAPVPAARGRLVTASATTLTVRTVARFAAPHPLGNDCCPSHATFATGLLPRVGAHPSTGKGGCSVQVGRCCLLNWSGKRRFRDLPDQKPLVPSPSRRARSEASAGLLVGGETGT